MLIRNINNALAAFLAIVIIAVTSTTSQVSAATIQIGDANLGATGVDTAGESRLNIELSAVNLVAGTYNVLQYEIDTDGVGNVTPLLFQRNALDSGYNVLWVGTDIAVTGTGAPNVATTNYTAGSEQFTLTGTTDVFVGAWHDGGARVRWQSGGATDHDGGATQSPTSFVVAQEILDSDITNSGIGRTYMVEATVNLVPEPSTFCLTAFGLLGLLACGRRRRR